MYSSNFSTKIKKPISNIAGLFLVVILLTGMLACSDSSSSKTPSDQVASGLYKNGTAELNSSATMPTDLRAFVHNKRIIMFSESAHLLFDGTINSINESNYTATVSMYETGVATQTGIAVTGRVTTESKITGTLKGTGNASGTFTLTFDSAYKTAAVSLAKIANFPDFVGDFLASYSVVGDTANDTYDLFSTNQIAMGVTETSGTSGCVFTGTLTAPNASINIYSTIDSDLTTADNPSACTQLPLNPAIKYSGFGALLSETGTENGWMYAITNGSYSVFGVLQKSP